MQIATVDVATAIRQVADGEFTLEAALVIIEDIMQRQAAGQSGSSGEQPPARPACRTTAPVSRMRRVWRQAADEHLPP
ncbi:hypothetical protein G6F54_014454 [Rhizopus delemar]|nr:hypothetical protein G6F54_014454 [Rhizopus delemar]